MLGVTHTVGSSEPSSPSNSDTWWDTDNDKYYVYVNDVWREYSVPSSIDWKGTRGISFGGDNGSSTIYNTIQYVNIPAGSGNSTDFGDLTSARDECKAASSGSRMICGGALSNGTIINNIDYIASATTANSADFGDLETGKNGMSVCGDGTYGIFMEGDLKEATIRGVTRYKDQL